MVLCPNVAKGYTLLTSSIGTGIAYCHSFWDDLHVGLRYCTAVGAAPTFQAVGRVLIFLDCSFPCGSPHGVSSWRRNEAKATYAKERPICRRRGSPADPQLPTLTVTKPVM